MISNQVNLSMCDGNSSLWWPCLALWDVELNQASDTTRLVSTSLTCLCSFLLYNILRIDAFLPSEATQATVQSLMVGLLHLAHGAVGPLLRTK